jgi:hypothetical protein
VIRPRLLAAVSVLAASLAAGVPAAGAAPGLVGVQVARASPSTDPAVLDRQLDEAARMGAKLVRVEARWSDLEPDAKDQRDPAAVAAVDRAVEGAAARGLRVLLMVDSTPCWASSAPATSRDRCTSYPPSDPGDAVPVATFLAGRYGSRLAAFEVWNEPDQANELYWAGPDKAPRYAALVRTLYRPLKQANPRMQVLAGAFVGYNGNFLRALYAAGIKGSYDALSVHFYDLTLWGARSIHALQVQKHDRTPIWIAESGWTSCSPGRVALGGHRCVTRAAQARFLGDLVRGAFERTYVKALVLYSAEDDGGTYAFGLADAGGVPKPAFAAVQKALGPRPGRLRALVLRPTVKRGRVTLSGSGPAADQYEIRVSQRGRLRYIRTFRLDTEGRFRLRLPAVLGSRGLVVRLYAPYVDRSVTRRV